MQYLGVEYSVRHMPELDPDFIPFGVWLEAYARGAEKPLTIALERDQGKISVRETKIHGTPEMAEADYRYVERYVKFLLWSIVAIGGHMEGCRIGFDAGGSDRKVSAVIDGKTVYSEEVVWHPKTEPDPQ